MSLTLTVDGERWRSHLREVAAANPGLAPLARKTQWLHDQGLGGDTLAVGTYDELPHVAGRFDGDLLVLTPWRPFGSALATDPALAARIIHTVGRSYDLADL